MKNHKNNPTMPVQGKGINRGQGAGLDQGLEAQGFLDSIMKYGPGIANTLGKAIVGATS